MLVSWARRVSSGWLNGKGKQVLPDYEDDRWVLECADRAFGSKQKTSAERVAMSEVIRRTFVINAE